MLAERDGLARALAVLADRLSLLDLDLSVETDPFRLREIHGANVASDAKTAPNHDIAMGPLPTDWRWFHVKEPDGRTAATSAVRLYDWGTTNAKLEVESRRAFSSFADVRERISCAVPPEAAEVTGRVAHSGALWIRPDRRRPQGGNAQVRIVRIMSMFNRFWAAWYGDVDWIWSLADRALADKGKVSEYGYERWVPGTAITWAGLPTRHGVFALKPRADILAEAGRVVEAGTENIGAIAAGVVPIGAVARAASAATPGAPPPPGRA